LFSASFLFFAAIRFCCRSFRTATFSGEVRTVIRYGFGPQLNFLCGVAARSGPTADITDA